VPIDLSTAKTWFELAARKGHVDAQTTLGLMQYDGGDRAAGLVWLKSAAEKGEPRALLIYGTALFNGDAVTRDPVLAYSYVSRAADQGLEAAKTTLAQMDRILPRDQRQQGLALAQGKMTETKSVPTTVAPPAAKPSPAKKSSEKAPAKQPTANPASPAKGGWRVQLGAFSKRGSAEALFKQLSGNEALAGRQPFFIAVGAVTRLQAGPFESRAAAAAACVALSAKGQPCFPVAAK
jgi:TPR repeat protein